MQSARDSNNNLDSTSSIINLELYNDSGFDTSDYDTNNGSLGISRSCKEGAPHVNVKLLRLFSSNVVTSLEAIESEYTRLAMIITGSDKLQANDSVLSDADIVSKIITDGLEKVSKICETATASEVNFGNLICSDILAITTYARSLEAIFSCQIESLEVKLASIGLSKDLNDEAIATWPSELYKSFVQDCCDPQHDATHEFFINLSQSVISFITDLNSACSGFNSHLSYLDSNVAYLRKIMKSHDKEISRVVKPTHASCGLPNFVIAPSPMSTFAHHTLINDEVPGIMASLQTICNRALCARSLLITALQSVHDHEYMKSSYNFDSEYAAWEAGGGMWFAAHCENAIFILMNSLIVTPRIGTECQIIISSKSKRMNAATLYSTLSKALVRNGSPEAVSACLKAAGSLSSPVALQNMIRCSLINSAEATHASAILGLNSNTSPHWSTCSTSLPSIMCSPINTTVFLSNQSQISNNLALSNEKIKYATLGRSVRNDDNKENEPVESRVLGKAKLLSISSALFDESKSNESEVTLKINLEDCLTLTV